ncbi:MAG: hypothetical protein RLZZ248_1828 [Bacteroidota bacterium]
MSEILNEISTKIYLWVWINLGKKNFFQKRIAGSKMLIPTPLMIQEYINHSQLGSIIDIRTMRNDLAIENGADFTCPMTTGIFLRIVAEYNFEKVNLIGREFYQFWIKQDS